MKNLIFALLTLTFLALGSSAWAISEDPSNNNPLGSFGASAKCPSGVCDANVTGREVVGASKIMDLPSKTGENDWMLPGGGAQGNQSPGTGVEGTK